MNINSIKFKICKDCRKCIQKNYVDCAFQSFDNEFCGDLEKIIKNSIKYQKISFAIERLEKVKDLVRDNSKATGFCFVEQTIDVEDFEDLIDNQIEELKRRTHGKAKINEKKNGPKDF